MHFFGIFSLSFLLAGANAGVLEQPGYTFQDLGDGTCTTTKQSFDGSQQPVTFEVSKTDKSMTVKHLNIVGNNNDPYQLSTSRIMAAVCRKCDLEPDNLTKVVMTVPTDDCLKRVLDVYRSLHDLEKNEKIVTTLALRKTYPDTDREVWLDLRYCPSPEIVYGMLTPASILASGRPRSRTSPLYKEIGGSIQH
ncbi:hypothetical protein CFIMG_008662RA00001 [Ceratocystis fimbriata CBS 114723]|uniref:Uncharacterized protein n=1 Tax=Ceratocystis fimbriata CBS 114723 TaxID=1035309 RepID=A0A2C5X0P6_9PEZI|nr:hypothetical protein CFIMG_008662RA00001 [Ceratocystis fimbriata CBS 114723]